MRDTRDFQRCREGAARGPTGAVDAAWAGRRRAPAPWCRGTWVCAREAFAWAQTSEGCGARRQPSPGAPPGYGRGRGPCHWYHCGCICSASVLSFPRARGDRCSRVRCQLPRGAAPRERVARPRLLTLTVSIVYVRTYVQTDRVYISCSLYSRGWVLGTVHSRCVFLKSAEISSLFVLAGTPPGR